MRFNVSLVDRAPDGSSLSVTRELTIKILPVNSAPGFTLMEREVRVFEDSGTLELLQFASDVTSDGTGQNTEPEQAVTFVVEFDHPELFSSPPAVTANGTLMLTVAPDAFGAARCANRLRDDGGVAFDGQSVSRDSFFTIRVLPVNDAPSFSISALAAVDQHSAAHAIPAFATRVAVGPPNEACAFVDDFCRNQTATFVVDDISDPSLFLELPYLGADGTLIFSISPYQTGEAPPHTPNAVSYSYSTFNPQPLTLSPESLILKPTPHTRNPHTRRIHS